MDMFAQLHLAAQYLATTAISFLEKKEDDSHANLSFSNTEKRLETRPLDKKGSKLGLDFPDFALQWISDEPRSLALHGKSHNEVVDWLKEVTTALDSSKAYNYRLHYQLPYAMGIYETFQMNNQKKMEQLIWLRILANQVLSEVLATNRLHSEVRIWPHHFDTGAFSPLNNSDVTIGLGLTIPDSLVADHYFYISGYCAHSGLDTSTFPKLSQGKWLNQRFKGAILPVTKTTDEKEATDFFNEAIHHYRKVAFK